MADGGLRRRRLPRHRPAVRHAGRRRRPARRRPRPRPAGDHRPGRQPHLRAAPLVRRGARRRARVARARRGTSSATARAGGSEPPNDWISAFGGPAWTRVVEPDGRPGQWYLHPFAPAAARPRLGRTPASGTTSTTILRFWFDRGVDGIRVDAAPAMAKVPGLPDAGHAPGCRVRVAHLGRNPHWDVDGVHDILRRWRRIGDSYDGDRLFVTEAVVNGPERLSRYVRPDEMHTSFNFDYLTSPWDAARAAPGRRRHPRRAGTGRRAGHLGAVQPRRDPARHPLRPGGHGRPSAGTTPRGSPTDLALGLRRARAAALLTLALPGSAYLYQGEELGLPEVEDLPEEAAPGPDLGAVRPHRPGPRRLPRAAAVGGRRARRSASRGDGVAPGCRSRAVGRAHRARAGGRPGVHAGRCTAPRCGCGAACRGDGR